MARLSLALIAAGMLSGCLIEDPPPLHEAEQTPLRLDYRGARPLLDQVIIARGNERIPFTIPVRSEDAGEELVGFLLLDYAGGDFYRSFMAATSFLAPSTLDDAERAFKFNWSVPPELKGCHRITLLAGHSSTLAKVADIAEVVDTDDLAAAYWWANLNVTPEDANVLRDCPDASRPNLEGP